MSTLRTPEASERAPHPGKRAKEKRAKSLEERVVKLEADVLQLQATIVQRGHEKEKLFDLKLKKQGVEAKIEMAKLEAKLEARMDNRWRFFRSHINEMNTLWMNFSVATMSSREEPRFEPSEALATELEECEDDIEIRESVIAVCDEQFPASKLLKQAKILPDKSPAAKSPAAKSPAATAAN